VLWVSYNCQYRW
jgi:hypothetical protein